MSYYPVSGLRRFISHHHVAKGKNRSHFSRDTTIECAMKLKLLELSLEILNKMKEMRKGEEVDLKFT